MNQAVPVPRNRVAKQPYIPTQAVRDALAACVAALEGLNVQEKGHVIARLGDMYHLQRVKPKKEVSDRKQKEAWKQEWETTTEYKLWQAAKLPKEAVKDEQAQARYQSLQQAAMAKRGEIKSRFLVGGQTMSARTQMSSSTSKEAKKDE
jgi:microcompartment protein CcmL/EutN